MKEFTDSDYGFVQKATSGGHPTEAAFHPSGEGSEEAAAAWDVAVGATLACDGAPPTLGDVALADGAAATESPCCSLRCSDTWYPIHGYQTNSLTTPRTGPERHALAPNATYLSRTPHIRPECHAPGPARDVPAPPRRVVLCNGPFGWMVSIVGCVGTVAHIL